MGRSRGGESLPVVVAVALVVAAAASGLVVLTDTAESRAENVGIKTTEIKAGDSFTVSYVDDTSQESDPIHVVLDEDGDGTYDSSDPATTVNSEDDGLATSTTFSDTDGLDGTYTVYVYEGPSPLSTGTDLTGAGSATIAIDGEPPWVSQFDLVNASGDALEVTMVTDEKLASERVALSGPETATLTDFEETDNGDTYTYTATHDVSTDGDYTASLAEATDDFGHDAADNQTLSDTATVDTTPPTVDGAETAVGARKVRVAFSEGVTDASGNALDAGDFTYADGSGDGATGITSVSHSAGSDTAVLTLDAPVEETDLGTDTVAPAADAVLDDHDNPAGTAPTALADTDPPAAPRSASSRPVNASNVGSYDLTVELADDHEAGTLDLTVGDGSGSGAVTASTTVANRTDGDADPHEVTFSDLDLSGLAEGQLSVEATLTDYGGNARTAEVATPTKDTVAPSVADATISNAPIGTYDVGTDQTVTVEFDEPMNTSRSPTVSITGLKRSYDVTGSFDDATTWTGTVSIVDDNEDTEAAIEVADAADAEGNPLATDASNTFRVNTTGPAKADAVSAGNVTASSETDYAVTVELVSGSDADEVRVRVRNATTGDAVVKSAGVAPDQTSVTVSGIDASSLPDGAVTVEAMTLDDGYPNIEGFVALATVEKDTRRPTVSDVSIEGGRVNDATAGTDRTVTVEFAEPMDTSQSPTVAVSGLSRSYDVTGSFDDATTWTGTLNIADDDEEATATVSVDDAADPVGNPVETATHDFPVDTDTPVVSDLAVTNPSDRRVRVAFESDQRLSTVGVTLDTPTGTVTLDRSDFAETGSGPYTYEATRDGSADGTYEATLDSAVDGMGNDGATGAADATVVDVTGPAFSAASPDGTSVADDRTAVNVSVSDAIHDVAGNTVELTVTDSSGAKLDGVGTGASGVSFQNGKLALDPAAAGLTFADGEVTVTVRANDTLDNRASTTFSFDVDTTAPTFGSGSPAGTVADARPPVNVSVSDATGVAPSSLAVTVTDSSGTKLDGVGTGASGVSFNGGELSVDPTAAGVSFADGEVTVDVRADDALGNRASTTFSFDVDTPPDVSGFDAVASGDGVTVSFDSTDDLSTVRVDVTGPNGTETLGTGAFSRTRKGPHSYRYTATYAPGADGEYDFRLDAAVDQQGDGATGQSATAAVDRADPRPASAWIADATAARTTLTVAFSEPVDASALAGSDVSVEGATVTGVSGTDTETEQVNVTVSGHVPTDGAPNLSFDAGSYTEAVGDGSGGTGESTGVHTVRLSLSPGKNFVSVPAVEGDVSLAGLDLTGVETIWTYDDDRWKSYDPGAPADDFSSLVGGKGYVFVANQGTTVDVTADNVADGSVRTERLEGDAWNLVGHWEEGDRPADEALGRVAEATIAAKVRKSDGDFDPITLSSATFRPGEAYWVYVSDNSTYSTTKY